jgi:hypothetical protein
MRLFLLLLALISLWNVSAFAYEKRVYINKEGMRVASVFSAPGYDSTTCQEASKYCKPVAWPDRLATVIDLGEREKVWVKDENGKDVQAEYAKVRVSYLRVVSRYEGDEEGYMQDINGVEGYIDAALITDKQQQSFYKVEAAPKKENCPPVTKQSTPLSNKDKKAVEPLKELAPALPISSVESVAGVLKLEVGHCINPAGKTPMNVTYDGFVYDEIMSKPLPKVVDEKGNAMTRKQLMDIDILSRTLYGEMAACYKYGLQYPMAVAKVSVNRAEAEKKDIRSEFITTKHRDKDFLGKILTDPYKYSLWNKKHKNKDGDVIDNPVLKQALCPPQDPKKKFWTGKGLPSQNENEIWEDTVKIATEAVMFPTSFNRKTANVKGYFYTSGMNRTDMRKMAAPSIQGRAVSREACTIFWTDGKP